MLAHDGGPQPNATLMQQLDRLAGSMTDAGYTFVTVRGLLAARGRDPRTESPVGRVPIAHNAGKCGTVSRHRTGEGDVSADAEPNVYALLTDGTTIEIRPARPDDFDAVREMHEKLSPDSLYLRFFSMSPSAAEREARRLCREPAPDHAALLAVMDGELIGCGSYECDDPPSRSAEIAFTVADDMHNRGVGMLLMEHLISLARGRGLRAFTAETLSENALMLRVFADAGLQAHRALADGVYDLTFPLPSGEEDVTLGTYRDAVAERERSADVASLRHVLAPASVAVIGASRRPGSVGRAILRSIVTGGFPGPVYAVNPAAAELDGVPCLPSAAALPEQVDLAVIATPAAAVPGIAEECGRRGVKALVVLAAGLDGAARAELLGICRRHGMRMVGPASYGVAGTSAGLDATFAARHPKPGSAGLALQSTGGAGFALVEHLSRIGVGISSLVSLGDKDDVAGNDMLLWWESDPATKLALLYLESIANPPKFARTARRVGRSMPVLTVIVGRSITGRRLAGARATAATPLLTRQALFEQAGVIAVANLGELLDTAALLATQPVPAGPRVAVVSNTRGAAVLAADACGDAGLQVARLAGDTQRALRDLLPRDATVTGPVDTTLLIGPGTFRQCLELAGADPGVDAVLALTTTSAGSDPVPEVPPRGCRCRSPPRCWTRRKWSGCSGPRARTPPPFRPMPTPSPPPAPSATPPATACGGRSRREPCPTSTACARTGPGNWSRNFWPQAGRRLAAAGPDRGTARLLRRAAGRQHRGRHRGRRRRGGSTVRGPGRAPGGRARPGPRAWRRRPADRSARRGRGPARVPLAEGGFRPPAGRCHRQADGHRRRRSHDQHAAGRGRRPAGAIRGRRCGRRCAG